MFEPNAESMMALLLDALVEPERESERVAPRPPSAAVRANLLTALDGNGANPYAGFTRRFARLFGFTNSEADAVLSRMNESEVWLPLGRVSLYHFEPGPSLQGAHAGLVRCQPGQPFPTHKHLGTETTLVLSGSIVDDDSGAVYLPGDIVSAPGDTVHHLSIPPPRECVFAVLMEGGFPDFD